jgi:hypothetical protein
MPAEEDDDEVVEEEDDEEETPQVAVNPFAAEVNRAQGKPQPRGLDNLPVGQEAAAAAPRPRGRPRKEGNGKTAPAPLQIEVDMESALDSLLGDSKSL